VSVSRRALLTATVSALASRVAWGDAPPQDVLASIARARAAVRSLQGPFTQTRTIALLATDVRSRGTMRLIRPDRLRWELEPPDDVTFWIGPEGLAYRSAHGRGRVPAGSARIAAGLDDLRTLLGGDLARLADRWSLRVLRDDASGVELDATGRDRGRDRAGPRSLRIELGADRVRPRKITLVGGDADRTVIEFGELVLDGPIDEAAMRPPE
jgi:hypothetical protein